MSGTTRFRFGDWEIDAASRALCCCGEPVAIQPSAFDLLLYLIENRDRVVPREELLERVWRSVRVTDGSLSNAIYQIRFCLCDDDRQGRWAIRTVPRRGVQFIATLKEVEPLPVPASAPGEGKIDGDPGFVGRASVLSALRAGWGRASSGRGTLVLLHGELGIGKTRTVQAFAAGVGVRHVHVGRCYERVGAPAFWPWVEILRSLAGEVVTRDLRAVDPALAELVPDLRERLAASGAPAPPAAGSAAFRHADAIRRLLGAMSSRVPLLLVLEDLHWADEDSLRLLTFLIAEVNEERLLLLGTYRDNSLQPGAALVARLGQFAGRTNVTSIELTGLDPGETHELLRRELGCEPSPEFVAAAERRTRGNPLFLGAIVRDLKRVPDGNLGLDARALEAHLPSELGHALSGLLATLSDRTRAVLQVAAVMGGEAVRLDVIGRVLELAHPALLDCLDEAARTRVVRRDDEAPETFRFEHILYRDVLYHEIASRRRARLHEQVAEALARVGSRDEGAHLSALAHHYYEATSAGGDRRRALDAALRAAQWAVAKASWQQAVEITDRALGLLEGMDAGPERDRQELALLMLQLPSLRALHGYADSPLGRAAARARKLSRALGEHECRPAIYSFLQNFYLLGGNYERSDQLGAEMLEFACDDPSSFFRDIAHTTRVVSAMMSGRLQEARSHLESMAGTLDPEDLDYWQKLGQDGEITRNALLAIVFWLQDEESRALRASDTALARSRALGEPFSRAYALYFSALLHQLRGDHVRVRTLTNELIPHCERYEIELFRVMGRLLAGWALAVEQDLRAGIVEIEAALGEIDAAETKMLRSYFLCVLAQCQADTGEIESARETIDQALDFAEKHGEQIYRAELQRLRGELLLRAGGNAARAERCFQSALEIATQQGARIFEQRARESVARAQGSGARIVLSRS